MKPRRIIVAPLDWGLGHATRCIPVIRLLLEKKCEVAIATSGGALNLLRNEFPNLTFYILPSYRATYSRSVPLMLKVFLQLPRFLLTISREHKAMQEIVKQNIYDFIISDNRYGCWSSRVPAVFIMHQVNIQMPVALRWLSGIINFFNHRQIRKFSQCWIPDFPEDPITGRLTTNSLPKTKWIGMLSRFTKPLTPATYNYKVAAIISGPEPQRTLLEEIVCNQLRKAAYNSVVVRGVTETSTTTMEGRVRIIDHLNSSALEQLIASAEVIICRSGYSSVMDLSAMGKRVVFIPTPGQTEQEYLAVELQRRSIAPFQLQHAVDIEKALAEINRYSGFAGWSAQPNLAQEAIDEILK